MCKIEKNNQRLLELRSQSVNEQNKLQDTGDEDDANESDVTAATEKTLDNDDETTLRGEASFSNNISDHSWCESFRKLYWEAEGSKNEKECSLYMVGGAGIAFRQHALLKNI